MLQTVDKVEITVLVDNYTDLLRSDSGRGMTRPLVPYGKVLLAEHALSLFVTARSGEKSFSFLMDAGGSEISLFHNAALLGVDMGSVSALIISHGHDDHTGAVTGILDRCPSLPVYVHPAAFSRRQKRLPTRPVCPAPPPDRAAWEGAGAGIRDTSGPTGIWEDRILVTGGIDRVIPFEQGNPVYEIEEGGGFVHDPFPDDQAVILSLRGEGLVILSGCAHAGIINTVEYARKITGIPRVHAIIGGFHLSGSFFGSRIPETVWALSAYDPSLVVPLHCTGWEAIHACMQEMPDRVVLNTVGSSYLLGDPGLPSP